MKHVFIINPAAGKKNPCEQVIPSIQKVKSQYRTEDFFIEITSGPKDAQAIAGRHCAAGEPVRLYAVGGDGTLNEVLAGAWQFPKAQVGCIPHGSGNDFIRNFGHREAFLSLEGQIQGKAVEIDLIEGAQGISAAITSTGFDADVAHGIPQYRKLPLVSGSMAYAVSVLERLFHPLGQELRIQMDGREKTGSYLIATVCNGQSYGGGFCAAPMAQVNDGFLDVILVKTISRFRVASIIGKYKQGRHFEDGRLTRDFSEIMEYARAKEVVITPVDKDSIILNVDGETGPAAKLYAKVMPLAARFILPALGGGHK